jgi:hypothetical protein
MFLQTFNRKMGTSWGKPTLLTKKRAKNQLIQLNQTNQYARHDNLFTSLHQKLFLNLALFLIAQTLVLLA